MENETFKIGDVVELKSGSPKMTVTYVDDDKVYTDWFNTQTNRFEQDLTFKEVALIKSNEIIAITGMEIK